MTVLVLCIHHREGHGHQLPLVARRLILGYLATLVGMRTEVKTMMGQQGQASNVGKLFDWSLKGISLAY